jgi:nidogen-like
MLTKLRTGLRNGLYVGKKNVLASLAILAAIGGSAALASTIDNSSGFLGHTLAPNDDESTAAVPIGFSINFYGTTYSNTFVNNNGNVTFGASLSEFTPFGLTGSSVPPIIAPFFADVDTSSAGSPVTYGNATVNGHNAFGVNYINVDYYNSSPSHTNRNSFQVILVDRSDTGAGNFDIIFNYGQIQWETGTASGGNAQGRGGTCAAAGYSNGTGNSGTNFQITGSLTCGAFLDGGPNALVSGTNNNTPGEFVFQVRGGQVVSGPSTPPPPLVVGDPRVATYGIMRQMNQIIGRHAQMLAGLRMDGLTGGADVLAAIDNIVKEAQGFDLGGHHIGIFGAFEAATGNFTPMSGVNNGFNMTHLAVGADDTFAIDNDLVRSARFGVIAGFDFTDSGPSADSLPISNTSVKSRSMVTVTGFAGLGLLDHGYADLTGTYSFLDYRMNRHFGTDVFAGATTTRQFDLQLRAGYDFPIEMPAKPMAPEMAFSLGPYGLVDYTYGTLDGFTETTSNAPLAALTYPSVNYFQWLFEFGGRINLKNQTESGYLYGVTLSAGFQHRSSELPNAAIPINTVSGLTSSAPFLTPEDNAGHLGARAWTAGVTKNMVISVDYNGVFGQYMHDNSVMLQARYTIQ